QPFRTQVILKHPIIARGPQVQNIPNRRHAFDPHGQVRVLHPAIEPLLSFVPDVIKITIQLTNIWTVDFLQKLIHRAHHVGMGVKRSTGKADVGRTIVTIALHQILAPADYANRQAASKRLAIDYNVGLYAKIFLRASKREAKPRKDLIKNQNDLAL